MPHVTHGQTGWVGQTNPPSFICFFVSLRCDDFEGFSNMVFGTWKIVPGSAFHALGLSGSKTEWNDDWCFEEKRATWSLHDP